MRDAVLVRHPRVVTYDTAFEAARFHLRAFSTDAALMGRLADIDDLLTRWTSGDRLAGESAQDALDQLRGLLEDDLIPTREAVAVLLQRLPKALSD